MPPSSGELWGHHLMPHTIIVDCLLPSGIIIQLDCMREAALENIKENLWTEAKKYPLFHLLAEPSCYIFVSITQDAELEEFYDESRRLCDLHLFQPVLKIIEPVGNREEKMLNYEIGITIGMAIQEFEGMKDREVHDFRRKILNVCRDAVEKRNSSSEYDQILYMFPPEVEKNLVLSPCVEKKLDKGFIDVDVWLLSPNNEKQKYSVKVARSDSPETIIAEAILQKVKSPLYTKEQQQLCVIEHQDRYLLKVCGTDEYLLQQHPIWQYKYVRTCIAKGHRPQLMLMSKEGVLQSIPKTSFHMPSFMRRTLPTMPSQQTLLLWQVNKILRMQILWATYVNVKEVDKIYVKTGIFHGTESLCMTQDTKHVVFSNPKWNEWLEYDMYISDIPRSAKLCFSICSISKRKRREEHCALAWGNINLFDFKSQFHTDRLSLHLWPFPKGMNDLLNPLGNAGSNPNKDSPCLEIEFDHYSHPVVFPTYAQISDYVKFTSKMHENTSGQQHHLADNESVVQTNLSLLHEISKRDPLSEISEQEKELIWTLQKHCISIPDSLPKLLDAVKWNSRDEVAQLYELLKDWPEISPETALELLDCKYPDQAVRKFAVKCLDKTLTDDKLSQYILQLVQVLKYEPYLDNELARFLLRRSLLNRKIGHFFFWHLRSEITNEAVVIKFGLLLEAYCRGIGEQLRLLTRQVEALEKLTKLTDSLKQRKDDTHKDRMRYFFDQIQQTDYLETLQSFPSPLNNCQVLGNLLVDECKILDSAKRPLWLVWNNPDPMAELFFGMNAIIFKNGDDLRQDMLTLQVIHIIDNIWRNEGLDLRMMPYACLATGKQVGLIEVVNNAKTVMGIQRTGGKMAAFQVDCTQLHKWIKEKNKDDR